MEDLVSINAPSLTLKKARRALDNFEEIKIISDMTFLDKFECWHIKFNLILNLKCNITNFPENSDWHLFLQDKEDYATIKFNPDKFNGLKTTYEHQYFNVETPNDWMTGYPCLEDFEHSLGKDSFTAQPVKLNERLHWYIKRLIEWCHRASEKKLIMPGENFEIPIFHSLTEIAGNLIIKESKADFRNLWLSCGNTSGTAILNFLDNNFFLIRMSNLKGEVIKNCIDEASIDFISNRFIKLPAIWIKLKNVPVVENWRVPTTWLELEEIALQEEVNLPLIVGQAYHLLKKGLPIPIIVLFPIPEKFNERNEIMHIQSFRLPPMTKLAPSLKKEKGKDNKIKSLLAGMRKLNLNWMKTENWDWKESSGRGQLNFLSGKRILLIGVGALGGFLSENLIRGGVKDLTLVDNDILKFGNLTRHILTARSIDKSKSIEVMNYLKQFTIDAKIQAYNQTSESFSKEYSLEDFDLVIDTTGSDMVLKEISSFEKVNFFSTSIGFKAENLYLIYNSGRLDLDAAYGVFRDSIEKDKEKAKKEGFPMESIGCWHPVFPADISDIFLAVSLSIKWLEKTYSNSQNKISVMPISNLF